MIYDLDTIQAEKRYKELLRLKKALGIDKDKEVSKSVLLDISKIHNKKEVFLLEFIIEQIKSMPKEIKKQYKILREKSNEDNFPQLLKQTEILYKTNAVFKEFYKKIADEIGFCKIKNSKSFLNMLIYEIAYEELDEKTSFSENNPVVNLYLLEKWLKKHAVIPIKRLDKREKAIVRLLTQGYYVEEIISLDQFNIFDIPNIIGNILPEKFQTDSIIKMLALYFYKL